MATAGDGCRTVRLPVAARRPILHSDALGTGRRRGLHRWQVRLAPGRARGAFGSRHRRRLGKLRDGGSRGISQHCGHDERQWRSERNGGCGRQWRARGAEAPCWTLELTPTTYDSASNCIGVHGTSAVNVHTDSTLELSYDSGDPCFTGTIASTGWGAVYELTFAGDDNGDGVWNASSAGVTGFEFAYRGSGQPSSLRVYYKDPSGVDNCYVIGPGSTSVPFSIAHPGCTASGETVDTARMDEVILAFPVRSDPYDVDFCVQIRAFD